MCSRSMLFPYNYDPDYMQSIVYPPSMAHLQGGNPNNANLPPPSLPPTPNMSTTTPKTDKKTLDFMKELMIDMKRNAKSKTAIKQLVQNKFSTRLSANGMTRAEWRNDFTKTLDAFKNPKIKYMLVSEGDFKVRVYMTIEGTAKNTNSVQYIGVMGIYQLTGDNKHVKHITTITTPLTKENVEHLKQLKFGSKAYQANAANAANAMQKGGDGYSINPEDQINFMPTYPRYTDNCRPVFNSPNLTGAGKKKTTKKRTTKKRTTKKPTRKPTKKPTKKRTTKKPTKKRAQRGGTAKCADPSLNDNFCAQKYDFPKCE